MNPGLPCLGLLAALATAVACVELEPDAEAFNAHVMKGFTDLTETAGGMGAALHPVEQGKPADLKLLRLTHGSFRAAVFLLQQELKEAASPDSPESAEYRSAYESYLEVQRGLAEGRTLRFCSSWRVQTSCERKWTVC